MRVLFLVCLIASARLPLVAADPPGFIYWPAGAPPVNGPQGAKFDNHGLGISSRDHNGLAEVHENQTDILVVQKGEATLVTGGELVDPKTIRMGELQGSSIKGGVKKDLSAGI